MYSIIHSSRTFINCFCKPYLFSLFFIVFVYLYTLFLYFIFLISNIKNLCGECVCVFFFIVFVVWYTYTQQKNCIEQDDLVNGSCFFFHSPLPPLNCVHTDTKLKLFKTNPHTYTPLITQLDSKCIHIHNNFVQLSFYCNKISN
jgi:energy-coupling factor transporter transmembrane protein EcfT